MPLTDNAPPKESAFARPADPAPLLAALQKMQFAGYSAAYPLHLMEVCGTHTMAIAKAGLRGLLPPQIKLISGPGCPVCVTPAAGIAAALQLAATPGVLVASYGDLLRVPDAHRNSLAKCRGQVQVVYCAMDCLQLAAQNPEKEVMFLGVGFETTAPGTAALVAAAKAQNIANLSVLCLLKRTEPALRALLADETCRLDGLLCPGHVATIIGSEAFRFLPRQYGVPAVVAGFESGDILTSVYLLCKMLREGKPDLINEYTRAVHPEGNPAAMAMVDTVFVPCDSVWRGLGLLPQSGYALRPAYAQWDAIQKFSRLAPLLGGNAAEGEPSETACRCGDMLRGVAEPAQCPLFGKACTPQNPVGPCMVSGEGACAAAYKYSCV